MADAMTRASGGTQLHDLVQRSPLPIAVVDLATLELVDANDAALEVLARPGLDALPLPLDAVLDPDEQRPASRALQLVADGTIRSYDARRHVRRADGETVPGRVWVRALPEPCEESALVVFLPEPSDDPVIVTEPAGDTIPAPAARVPLGGPVVVGSFDAGTRITQISTDSKTLLRKPPETLLGQALVDLVHQDDVMTLLTALGSAVSGDASVGVRLRVRRADGRFASVRAVVTPTRDAVGTRFGFVLTPELGDDSARRDRVAELEQHLWRIAAEVQAAGVVDTLQRLPDNADLPGLAQLSTRQWQVLSGLLRGERVPDIARSMFVSQSTVRNHLANIFRALGVHSQAELLALLRQHNQRNV
jgi:DNA-binding CsgD family transcriptional regulator/PAS domain-containing protein